MWLKTYSTYSVFFFVEAMGMLRVFTMRRYISSKIESLDSLENTFIVFKTVAFIAFQDDSFTF